MELEAVEAAPLMERAFVANLVDESLRGDWEEVQMDLGLKPFRETPALDDVPVRWEDPVRWREPEMKTLSNPDQINAAKRAKAKKKRNMEKETRKKNRKRKKWPKINVLHWRAGKIGYFAMQLHFSREI